MSGAEPLGLAYAIGKVGQARAVPGHTIENPIAHAQPILVEGEQQSLFPGGGGLDRAKGGKCSVFLPAFALTPAPPVPKRALYPDQTTTLFAFYLRPQIASCLAPQRLLKRKPPMHGLQPVLYDRTPRLSCP